MKKFKFSLRAVATIRDLHELKARETFGRATQALVNAEKAEADAHARVAALAVERESARSTGFAASGEIAAFRALEWEVQNVARAVAAVATARTEREKAQTHWLATRRDQRVVGKLEERARVAYRLEFERAQQAVLDERAAGRPAATLEFTS